MGRTRLQLRFRWCGRGAGKSRASRWVRVRPGTLYAIAQRRQM